VTLHGVASTGQLSQFRSFGIVQFQRVQQVLVNFVVYFRIFMYGFVLVLVLVSPLLHLLFGPFSPQSLMIVRLILNVISTTTTTTSTTTTTTTDLRTIRLLPPFGDCCIGRR